MMKKSSTGLNWVFGTAKGVGLSHKPQISNLSPLHIPTVSSELLQCSRQWRVVESFVVRTTECATGWVFCRNRFHLADQSASVIAGSAVAVRDN